VKIEVGDKVKLIVMKTEGVVTDTSFNRVKVRFEGMDSSTHESIKHHWFDKNWVRKVKN